MRIAVRTSLAVGSDGTAEPSSGSSGPSTFTDLAISVLTVSMVVAFVPATMFPSWTPRMSLLLCTAVPGIVVLLLQAVSRDGASMLAASFAGVAAVSSVLSDAFRSSAVGFVGRDLSVVVVLAAFGVWAWSRTVTAKGARLVGAAFVCSASLAAAVAVVQVVADVERGSLALQSGRPMSFLVNPVYLGAVCAAGAVGASASAGTRWGWYHVAAGLTAAAAVLSGSRIAWAAMVVLATAGVVRERTRSRAGGAGALAGGLVIGLVLDRWFTGGANSLDRATGESAGRFTVWKYGLDAWTERPLLGHGVGLFRPAVQARFTPDFVRSAAFDDGRQPWFDAHNVVVGVSVATGVLGLVVLIAWFWFVVREARGPAAWAAAAIAMTWLLQPVSIVTLPIAMILLGISMPFDRAADRPGPRLPRGVLAASACLSVALGVGLLVADLRLKSAVDERSIDDAVSAAAWFPGDPVVANIVAQVARLDGGDLRPNAQSLEWRERAAQREPDRPYWWNLLAEEQLQLGDVDAAARSVETALQLQPSNYASNRLALDIAVLNSDREAIDARLDLLCELEDRACAITVDDMLRTEEP